MAGQRVGYARVSDQNPRMQLDALEAAGCLKVYKDTATGTKATRPQWIRCLDDLRTGDTLIIWRIDRLGRNLRDLIDIITTLETRGVGVQSLTNGIVDTTTTHGKLVFGMFALMARIRSRTHPGAHPCQAGFRGGGVVVGDDDGGGVAAQGRWIRGLWVVVGAGPVEG